MRTLAVDGPARLLARPGVRAALAALAVPGEETRLVGGCVRDALLGIDAADIDLATTLLPDAVAARGRAAGLKAIPTGIEHGTVTLIACGEPIEVTTLREDIATDGRHAIVRFGRDFRRDAERRDFTVNALFLGADGRLADTVGGLADLEAGRVRFIGDAATRLGEDALRILRFFRFHARFGDGPPDPGGLAACIAARGALATLSRERVRAEFLKLLMAPGARAAIDVLSETGLLTRITGGVGEAGRLSRVAAAKAPAATRLAALAVATRDDAARLRKALRLSKAEHAALDGYARALAALKGRATIDARALRALVAEHGTEAVGAALAATAGEPRPLIAAAATAAWEALGNGPLPVLPVGGADLVARGIPAGPRIGRALAAARRLWLAEGCPAGPDATERLIALALASDRRTPPPEPTRDADPGGP
ncbi:CCA tRNA nucleotidyltransferase [uncultured Methylobacterium sp.]|uniref:CCA tRNA nucleotidyltransferase n=1 Tax=uncultured Methylobacterium sp. TaxID=157278 RepID=UPI0035C9EFA9